MKLYSITILTFILGMFFFNSCIDEEVIKGSCNGDGTEVTVSLPFLIDQSEKIQTRAGDKDPEFLVYDLYLYVFDGDGNIISRKYYESADDGITYDSQKEIGKDGVTNGTLKITLTTGDRYILAVANPKSTSSSENVLSDLESASNRSELEKVITSMRNETIERVDGRFLMTGYYKATENSTDKGKCNITASTTVLPGKIWLDRVDAKVQFVVTCGKEGATFTPTSWQVLNVPTKSYLFGNNTDVPTCTYFNSKENKTFNPYTIDNKNYEGFLFYMQESNKRASVSVPSYAARDEENKDANGLNTTYKYAPQNSTYILLQGKYQGKGMTNNANGEKEEKEVEANVRFVIHLGNTNYNDFENFQTLRNTHYIYKVTVMGVNDIIVEVEDNREDRPGAEGDVIVKDGDNVLTLDAHYEAKVLTFNQATLQAKNEYEFAYIVKTPFTDNMNVTSRENAQKASINADWVRFVRHTKESSGNGSSRKYIYKSSLYTYPGENNSQLLTIQQLLDEIKTNRNAGNTESDFFDSNNQVKYTCYIDEYYYDQEPGKTDVDLKLWKKFVNQPNRDLYILCDVKESTDKESTVTKAAYVLSQRAIQTFYNTDAQGLDKAWGVELKQETPDVPRYTSSNTASYGYGSNKEWGRKNMTETNLVNKNWSNVLDLKEEHTLTSSYTYSYAACMSRNRDIDGDGTIDQNEMQWYLPTLNQYTAMFVGEYGMDTDARMYYEERNQSKWVYKHFISSYQDKILWAEEGASTGSASNSYAPGKKFKHRCARNLGIGRNDSDTDPQNYKQYNDNVFTMNYLNDNSLRQDKIDQGELNFHGTFEEGNKLYKKFRVSKNIIEGNYTWNGVNAMAKSPCDTYTEDGVRYWRLPNLNELALMAGEGILSSEALATRTYFQYQNVPSAEMPSESPEGRRGHAWNGTNMYLFNRWGADNSTYDVNVQQYGITWSGGSYYKWLYIEYKKGGGEVITEVSNVSSEPAPFDDRTGYWEEASSWSKYKKQNGTVTVTRKTKNPEKEVIDINVSLRCVKDID